MREFVFKYNNIDFQDLKTAYELSYTSWNNIINQLREQTNNNTTYAETLQTWLFGSHELPYIYTDSLGDATNFYDYIQECLQNIKSSLKDLQLITRSKLNKVTVPTIVYATDSTGASTHILYNVSSIAKAIVQRDDSGRVEVEALPTEDQHATNKKYVDDKIKNNMETYEFSTDFPAVGEVGKFYISTHDDLMHYWNGQEYKKISNSANDFDVIDGGDADEYDIPYDIFDGGGA